MTQATKAQEPSMEEILASIRRIITDDSIKPVEVSSPQPALSTRGAAPRMDQMIVPTAASSNDAPPPPKSTPLIRSQTALVSENVIPAPDRTHRLNSKDPASAPLSTSLAELPGSGVNVIELTRSMERPSPLDPVEHFEKGSNSEFVERKPEQSQSASEGASLPEELISNATKTAVNSAFNALTKAVGQNARTLEDLVKEMLRPMLKSWLDDNLPGMVERLVRAEIERVSRGR